MAKQVEKRSRLVARHEISHGAIIDGKNVVRTFKEGESVEGLDKTLLKQLSDLGAIEQREVEVERG